MTKAWPLAVDDVRVTVAVQLAGAVGDATIVNWPRVEPDRVNDWLTHPLGDALSEKDAAGDIVVAVPAVREITSGEAAVPDGRHRVRKCA
jgi:hypothetical protein